MYSYKIEFISLDDTIAFEIKSENIQIVEIFVNDLLSIFVIINEEDKPIINSLQVLSDEIRSEIEKFIDKYKTKLPQLNAVLAFFNRLNTGDKFLFLPNIKLELAESIKIRDYLRAETEGISYEELTDKTSELFGETLQNYHIGIVGDKRIYIGEQNKSNRLCRVCQNKSTPTTFDSKAHAISEALGNKTVVLFEECDICNKRFSETIEPDIIQYLSLFRTIFKVKGKGGDKKFKGKNFDLSHTENVNLKFYSHDDRPENPEEEYKLNLKAEQPIIVQNIYKSLCKYFLSIIDKKYLIHFEKTIDWINGDIKIDRLPKVAEMISYHAFTTQPKLMYYIRQNDNNDLPFAVGEFHFTCVVFAFVVPLSNKDSNDFLDKESYGKFWKAFKHFDKTNGWKFNDFSNNSSREFTINLNFDIKNKNGST